MMMLLPIENLTNLIICDWPHLCQRAGPDYAIELIDLGVLIIIIYINVNLFAFNSMNKFSCSLSSDNQFVYKSI